MSHVTGKIEILGQMPDKNMLFKYHQAKYEKDQTRIFCEKFGTDRRAAGGVITDSDAAADCFLAHAGLCRRSLRDTLTGGMSCGHTVP